MLFQFSEKCKTTTIFARSVLKCDCQLDIYMYYGVIVTIEGQSAKEHFNSESKRKQEQEWKRVRVKEMNKRMRAAR